MSGYWTMQKESLLKRKAWRQLVPVAVCGGELSTATGHGTRGKGHQHKKDANAKTVPANQVKFWLNPSEGIFSPLRTSWSWVFHY